MKLRSLGGALLALGLAFLGASILLGRPALPGWLGFVAGFLPATLGALLMAIAPYLGRPPGISNDGVFHRPATSRGWSAWVTGAAITAFYVVLYWWPEYLAGAIGLVDPLSHLLTGGPATQWFLYGFLYTLAILVMSARMYLRYRHNRYQIWRTASVAFFQLSFAFLIPAFLKNMGQPEFYFTYFWPLKYDYLFPSGARWLTDSGAVGTFMFGWGIVASFVATPILTYYHGKRWYCSWVCGCGGLAETAGDPYRHLSDKSTRAWRFERWSIHLVLVLIVVTTAMLWINSATEGAVLGRASGLASRWYGFIVGAVLSGVVGVGFYPLLGSRVWCRFFCPMAAVLGLFQRFFSRFRITTNGGQCISCGNCSTYCEMGIDVRSYAQRGVDLVRASCVGCGICAAVCPRGVLKLENGATHADRFDLADRPLHALFDALKRK